MHIKYLGWIAFEADWPIYKVLESIAEFQNEIATEGYVTYMTYTPADETISDELGIVFSSEPITEEEAYEALREFMLLEEDESYEEEDDDEDN